MDVVIIREGPVQRLSCMGWLVRVGSSREVAPSTDHMIITTSGSLSTPGPINPADPGTTQQERPESSRGQPSEAVRPVNVLPLVER